MSYFLGIDPDLSSTALAIVDGDLKIEWVGLAKSKPGVWNQIEAIKAMPDWERINHLTIGAAIENQQIIPRRAGERFRVDPMDILHLAQVAGCCMGLVKVPLVCPLPVEWKGSVPKEIHQARILTKAGVPFVKRKDFCYPESEADRRGYSISDWKHICDAVGLAQWIRSHP